MDNNFWPTLIKESIQEAMYIAHQAELFVHDEMIPALLEREPPANRLAFYKTVDWDALRDMAPDIWTRVSADALNLEETEKQQHIDALQQLAKQQAQDAKEFKPQIQSPPIFGIKQSGQPAMTSGALGLDELPMGRVA